MASSCSVLNSPTIRSALLEGELLCPIRARLCSVRGRKAALSRAKALESWKVTKTRRCEASTSVRDEVCSSKEEVCSSKDEVFRPPLGWTISPSDFSCSRYSVAVEATPPPPRQKKDDEKGKDYHVNVGYAIRSLREELPGMFYREPTFDIYRDDIIFRDPLITFRGIKNYKLMFWGLRFYGRLFFKAIWIEILRIWQPSDRVIMVRWAVHGIPRVPWESRGQFDGTSEYKLDAEGLICEHKVDNVILNSPPKYKPPAVLDLVVVAGGGQPAITSFLHCLVLRFTWVRFYVALRGTLIFSAPFVSVQTV